MQFSDIPDSVLATLKTWRYDRIVEKHEGPEDWASFLEYVEPAPIDIGGRYVLLPRWWEDAEPIVPLRYYFSPHGESLTLFLKDPTMGRWYPNDEILAWGFLAICDRIGESDFFAAVAYHEWFIVDNRPPAGP